LLITALRTFAPAGVRHRFEQFFAVLLGRRGSWSKHLVASANQSSSERMSAPLPDQWRNRQYRFVRRKKLRSGLDLRKRATLDSYKKCADVNQNQCQNSLHNFLHVFARAFQSARNITV